MRTPPNVPINKFTHHARLEECEVVASNALTAAKEALAQLKLQPPRGETGATGPAGLSIRGERGRDGKDGAPGRDAVGITGPQGASIKGDKGNRGEKGDKGDTVVGPAGKDGKDSTVPGPQGPRGDITIVGDAELLAAVQQLRAEKARFLAAVEMQLEHNTGRKHTGLRTAIANVLQTIKNQSR